MIEYNEATLSVSYNQNINRSFNQIKYVQRIYDYMYIIVKNASSYQEKMKEYSKRRLYIEYEYTF